MSNDPRIDSYIAAAAPFAHPILETLRALVHEACPDAAETIRWGAPAYTVKGKLLCITPAFKAHAALSFWAKDMAPRLGEEFAKADEAMGTLGKLTTVADLPPRAELRRWLQAAAALAAAGTSARPASRPPKPALVEPPDLVAALADLSHTAAARTWSAFTPGKRRDYIEWLTEAKQPATRERRLAQTLQQLAEGKERNWKYRDC